MKHIFQILFFAVAVLGLASCTTYVEERGYVSSRPVGYYRSPAVSHGVIYSSSNRYHRGSPVSYRSSSRYGYRDHDRHDRYDRDRYDRDRYVRHGSRSSRSSVDARVNTNLRLFR